MLAVGTARARVPTASFVLALRKQWTRLSTGHATKDAGARLRGAGGLPTKTGADVDEAKQQQAMRYRTRAEQIRTTAHVMTHHESKIALLRLAESYDRLAIRAEHERPPSN